MSDRNTLNITERSDDPRLNLSAIQDLHAIVQSQATTIADLVKRIELLEVK